MIENKQNTNHLISFCPLDKAVTTITENTDESSSLLLPAQSLLRCSHDGELLPDDTNCRKYFKCSNGSPATQSCPGTLIFDPVLSICNWPDQTTCIQELKPKVSLWPGFMQFASGKVWTGP